MHADEAKETAKKAVHNPIVSAVLLATVGGGGVYIVPNLDKILDSMNVIENRTISIEATVRANSHALDTRLDNMESRIGRLEWRLNGREP